MNDGSSFRSSCYSIYISSNVVIKSNDNVDMTGISTDFCSRYEHSIFIITMREAVITSPCTHPSLMIYTHMHSIYNIGRGA